MRCERLPEPELAFKEESSTNCKTGLLQGPYSARRDTHAARIRVGVIGPKHLVESCREWVACCNGFIESRPIPTPGRERPAIDKRLFPDFPGCPTAYECTLVTDDAYVQFLSLADFAKLDKNNPHAYLEILLRLFEEKIKLMVDSNVSPPDVILCLLTNEMYDICHIVGDYHERLRRRREPETQLNLFKDFDEFNPARVVGESRPLTRNFRSCLKKLAMRPDIRIPITFEAEDPGR